MLPRAKGVGKGKTRARSKRPDQGAETKIVCHDYSSQYQKREGRKKILGTLRKKGSRS